jgi:biotin operon repressor
MLQLFTNSKKNRFLTSWIEAQNNSTSLSSFTNTHKNLTNSLLKRVYGENAIQIDIITTTKAIATNKEVKPTKATPNHCRKLSAKEKQADVINTKIQNRVEKLHKLETAKDTAHATFNFTEAFDLSSEIMTVDGELITLAMELQQIETTSLYSEQNPLMSIPEYKACFVLGLSATKTLARGKKYTTIKDSKKSTHFAPPHLMAQKLLRGERGIIDIEDIIQETYCKALEHLNRGDIWTEASEYTCKRTGKTQTAPRFAGNEGCIMDVYNTAQELLQNQFDRHSKKAFKEVYDHKGNVQIMEYTKAMREYEAKREHAETSDILQQFSFFLSDIEIKVLRAKMYGRQKVRATDTKVEKGNNKRTRTYKEVFTSQEELAEYLGITRQNLRTIEKRIKTKAEKHLIQLGVHIKGVNDTQAGEAAKCATILTAIVDTLTIDTSVRGYGQKV